MSDNKTIKTSIGGQALTEGIMMRGPKKTSMAVRRPDGSICLETEENSQRFPKIKKIPVVRGIFTFVDSMITGYKYLMRSVEISFPEETAGASDETKESAADITVSNDTASLASTVDTADGNATSAASASEKDTGTPEAAVTADVTGQPEGSTPDETVPADVENKADTGISVANTVSVQETATENVLADGMIADVPAAGEATTEGPGKKEEKKSQKEKAAKEDKPLSSGEMTFALVLGVVLGFALAIFLFKFLPELVYGGLTAIFPGIKGDGYGYSLLRAAVTGVLKIVILVCYMAAVSCIGEIRRTFMYHGAEHKTIFCYEQGLPLTVENVRLQKRFHPRCGTSFLVLSVLVSIFFGMFIPSNLVEANEFLNVLARTGIGLLMLPFIMGVGYELIRLAGKHDNGFTRFISAPGMWLQHITTKEPDDSMIECAIAAVKEVIPDDGSDVI